MNNTNGAGHHDRPHSTNYHINVLIYREDDSSQKAFPCHNIKSHRKSIGFQADATGYRSRSIIRIIISFRRGFVGIRDEAEQLSRHKPAVL